MAVSSVSSTPATSSSLGSSRQSIADNFDTFLSLLTTQLKNQNPLDPLDTNQFTSQLVQFSSVEQQLKTNTFLETMLLSTQNASNTQAVSFIGKTVTASGTSSDLSEGKATWSFTLPEAATVTVTVKDKDGNAVYTEQKPLPAGAGQFAWDGKGTDGTIYPDGTYTASLDARSGAGATVAVSTETTGTVAGVDLTGSEPVLIVGAARIKLSSITSVRTAS
jgi:flagellar basal-body rod modification protein FlgD